MASWTDALAIAWNTRLTIPMRPAGRGTGPGRGERRGGLEQAERPRGDHHARPVTARRPREQRAGRRPDGEGDVEQAVGAGVAAEG